MWEGLDSLAHLDLSANRIRVLEPGAFAGLLTLSHLNLKDNELTTLNQNAFAREIFSDDHYPHPGVLLKDNPLHCADWVEFESGREYGYPRCANYPLLGSWWEIREVLNCTQKA